MKKCSWTLIIACLLLFENQAYGQWVRTDCPGGGSVNCLTVSKNRIFVISSDCGVSLSTDNGASWTAVDYGLPSTGVWSLAVSGNTLFAGTSRYGLWRRSLSEMVDLTNARPQREAINQERFKIGIQSHAGSVLAVEFTIPFSEQVAVTMYDLSGKELLTLVDKQLAAGSYRYSLDTHSFARGCYMLKMQAGINTCTKAINIMQ